MLLLLLPQAEHNSAKHLISLVCHSCTSHARCSLWHYVQSTEVITHILDRLLRSLTIARPVTETCILCRLRRDNPTYLRPQICVAVQFVGLDVYVLLRSLPCSSNLRCKVFGGQLHHCQAVCSIARVSDLDDGLHLSANHSCRSESFKTLQLQCKGITIMEFHANSSSGVVKIALIDPILIGLAI